MAQTVKVNLDRKRPYRPDHESKEVVWVGPGQVEVPEWVARAWGFIETPEPAPTAEPEFDNNTDEEEESVELSDDPRGDPYMVGVDPEKVYAPWPGYDDLRVTNVALLLQRASDEEKLAVYRYEKLHKNRRTVMNALRSEFDAKGMFASGG